MFKNFLIMSLTAIFSGCGLCPFIPPTQLENNTQYYSSSYSGYGTSVENHIETFQILCYTELVNHFIQEMLYETSKGTAVNSR